MYIMLDLKFISNIFTLIKTAYLFISMIKWNYTIKINFCNFVKKYETTNLSYKSMHYIPVYHEYEILKVLKFSLRQYGIVSLSIVLSV